MKNESEGYHVNKVHKTIIIIFITYILVMIWELFLGNYRTFNSNRSYNLIPLKTVLNYVFNSNKFNAGALFINLAANIIVFIPLGFLLPMIKENMRNFRKIIIICFTLILGAESIQYIFNVGIFDVDDIILNMMGIMIGFLVFRIMEKNKGYFTN